MCGGVARLNPVTGRVLLIGYDWKPHRSRVPGGSTPVKAEDQSNGKGFYPIEADAAGQEFVRPPR